MIRVTTVVGARPQFVKAAAVSRAIATHNAHGTDSVVERIVHTGQHYDPEMSDQFFADLGIPEPTDHLGVGSALHGAQTGRMMERLEAVLMASRPDVVLLYGDTNSTLAGALVGAKLDLPIAHVEAGLRSHRRAMPEEINRVVTDRLSSLLFCPSDAAVAHLAREGILDGVHLVGDVMHDVMQWQLAQARGEPAPEFAMGEAEYVLVTVHRAENTDDECRLAQLLKAFTLIAEAGLPVIFPVHPRTRQHLRGWRPPNNVKLVGPLAYHEMVRAEAGARAIVTDSGGVQKEAYWLGVPCVTVRDETEWVETVTSGWNTVTGTNPEAILAAVLNPRPTTPQAPLYGNPGAASERIVETLVSFCGGRSEGH